jgi:hypothetical protein
MTDRRRELLLYVVAGVSYVVLGMQFKWLLNWILGPLWLIAIVWLATRNREERQQS